MNALDPPSIAVVVLLLGVVIELFIGVAIGLMTLPALLSSTITEAVDAVAARAFDVQMEEISTGERVVTYVGLVIALGVPYPLYIGASGLVFARGGDYLPTASLEVAVPLSYAAVAFLAVGWGLPRLADAEPVSTARAGGVWATWAAVYAVLHFLAWLVLLLPLVILA